MSEKVLIIKAGYSEFLEQEKDSRQISFGDVLRVTPILYPFRDDDVTWVTDEKAFPLLEGNDFIKRLLRFDWINAYQLLKERFDTLINLEKVPGICAFADDIYSVRRFGFRFDPELRKAKAYDQALEVLTVSSSPESKRRNRRYAQDLLFAMVGEKWKGEEYILGYKPKKQETHDVGLNVRVGHKWPTKAWPIKNWDKLEERLEREGVDVSRQDKQSSEVLRDLYSYMDWINSCRSIITTDSLGLHLALALRKKVVALFGPTPHQEVFLYDRGRKVLPPKKFKCAPCFLPKCKNDEYCMEHLPIDEVFEAFISLQESQ